MPRGAPGVLRKPWPGRFWEKVQKRKANECWPWMGAKNSGGRYGMFRDYVRNRSVVAHRIAYELTHGIIIPPGMAQVVIHTCDNGLCCNPRHLRLATMQQNSDDMIAKKRHRHPVGSAHPNSKLTEILVRQYRREIADGKSVRRLSKETGLDLKTLWSMWHRKSWRHIP